MKPMILTSGDPAGVGPEISIKVASHELDFPFVIAGVESVLREAQELYAPDFTLQKFDDNCSWDDKTIYFQDFGLRLAEDWQKGVNSADCGKIAYEQIVNACLAVVNQQFSAIVTAPVSKEAINMANIPFIGHTELVAELSSTEKFNMMQSADTLRCVFATCHIALNRVSKELSVDKIMQATRLLNQACLDEGIERPKLAAAGLNPHAGENGYMGIEEIHTVNPALDLLRQEGIDIEGPFPPDTLFVGYIREQFDGIVCMYHDQGHIPFKMLAFDRGVNSTLGLPIIRTSVDHGTAFNIAWQDKADTGSLEAALKLAWKRVQNH